VRSKSILHICLSNQINKLFIDHYLHAKAKQPNRPKSLPVHNTSAKRVESTIILRGNRFSLWSRIPYTHNNKIKNKVRLNHTP
jgi:hypothetical protein